MGIGVQGLANVFHELLIPYDSPQARELNRQIFETMYYFALQKSCSIAKQKGSYRTFEGSPLSSGLFHFDLYDEKYPYKFKYDWDPLRQEIKQYGTRNSLLIALMPTASTSQILGNVESFECLTSNFYTRRTLSGEFYVVNRTLQNIMKACHLWNENQKEELIFNKGSILHFKNIPTRIKDVFRTVWEISQKNLIDMSADRGYFIDQSQSFNIYLNEPNMELLNKIHFYGYKKGLKTGSYYVRQRAIASAQNFSISSEKEKEFMECENCSA
jgi:ribonucleoside-diphosphate reductase subunit M1